MWYSSAAVFPAPFNRRFHLLLNLAVGGNWPGAPDFSTTFPQEMVLDYVRVFHDASTGIDHQVSVMELDQNRPNPFNDYSTIGFSLPSEQHVLLEVYDALGRRVRTLANQPYGPGAHQVVLEAGRLEPGTYFYCLQAGSSAAIRQLVIL
jgi:hypothetical protein